MLPTPFAPILSVVNVGPVTRRQVLARTLRTLGVAAVIPLLAACGAPSASTPAAEPPANPLIKPTANPAAPMTPILATSELAIGRNRFVLGLIDPRSQPITTGSVLVEFFKVNPSANTAEKRDEAQAAFRSLDTPQRGTWVAPIQFDVEGPWGAQITHTLPDNPEPRVARLSFQVLPRFTAPGYGEPAPKSRSLTLADVDGDASRICSNVPPCDMHDLSIADAIAAGDKPLVILFATPAFCTSATCGPALTVVQRIKQQPAYAERATFIHVEVYEHPFGEFKRVQAMQEWQLPSEPWLFLVDRQGNVRERYEGAASAEEIEPPLTALVASS